MYSMYNSRENLQHYSTSHENSSMLGSINLEIYLSHQNLSQIKKKICKLKQFSNNSRENSSMLGSLNLENYISHQNLSQIKKKICKLKQLSNNSHENLKCLTQ